MLRHCKLRGDAASRQLLFPQGPEKRAEYGIKDNLIRFSCGLESVEDIWTDIEQALAAI